MVLNLCNQILYLTNSGTRGTVGIKTSKIVYSLISLKVYGNIKPLDSMNFLFPKTGQCNSGWFSFETYALCLKTKLKDFLMFEYGMIFLIQCLSTVWFTPRQYSNCPLFCVLQNNLFGKIFKLPSPTPHPLKKKELSSWCVVVMTELQQSPNPTLAQLFKN